MSSSSPPLYHQQQLPFQAKDFVLFRRDSPNLISINPQQQQQQHHQKNTTNSWIADYFIVASSSSSSSSSESTNANNSSNTSPPATSSANVTSVIIIHICPITGQFLHENKPGVDVFSSRAEAYHVLEKKFGCVRVRGHNGYYELCSMYEVLYNQVMAASTSNSTSTSIHHHPKTTTTSSSPSSTIPTAIPSSFSAQQQRKQQQDSLNDLLKHGGEFNYLLGACFVRNIPGETSSVPKGVDHLFQLSNINKNQNNNKSLLRPSLKTSASDISNFQNEDETGMSTTSGEGNDVESNYSYSTNNNNNNNIHNHDSRSNKPSGNNGGKINQQAPSSSSIPMIEMYLIVANEEQDSSKFIKGTPGLAKISKVRAIKVSSNLVGVLCDPQVDYTSTAANHALHAREIETAYPTTRELLASLQSYEKNFCIHCRKSTNNHNETVAASFEPSFYSSADFLQVDRDEEKYRKLSVKAKESETSLQAVLSSAEIARSFVDTRARIVPWNYGLVVPLHRAQTSGFSRMQQSLSWLCVKVSLVFEFVNDLPLPSSSEKEDAQQHKNNNNNNNNISRIVSIPTFMFLKSSFVTLPRWNQVPCGLEVASYCFSSMATTAKDDTRNQDGDDDDDFFSVTWVCSRPPSEPSTSLTPLHSATKHLSEAARKELYTSLESEMRSKIQARIEEQQQQKNKSSKASNNKQEKKHMRKHNLLAYSRDPYNDFVGDFFVDEEKLALKPIQSTIEALTLGPQLDSTSSSHNNNNNNNSRNTKSSSTSFRKPSWSDFLLAAILPQRGESNTSRNLQLRTLIVDFCSSVCKVRPSPSVIVGLSKIRPISDPPVVNIKINKSPVSAQSLATNSSLITDILPNGKLRGIWYNNRILRNSISVTFAVPFGCKIAGIGFLRPVFPRSSMSGSSSSSSSSSIANPNAPYLPPLRTASFSPYPISNRPELKYRSPFPSSAWTVSVGVSTIPNDESPHILLHDVSVPLVLYSETKYLGGSGAQKSKSPSPKSTTEHALCVIRTPDLATVESRGFLTVPNEETPKGAGRSLNNNNNATLKRVPSGPSIQDDWAIAHGLKDVVSTTATPRCSFVTVVLRGSTNAEAPFGAHQIVLFGELPDPSSDVCILDHQTSLKSVDPISTGRLSSPSSSLSMSNVSFAKNASSLVSFPPPQNLHDAFIAEEKRLALQLPAAMWNSFNTIHNGNQLGKLNLNAHVCEFLVSQESSKLITMAGGNFSHLYDNQNQNNSNNNSAHHHQHRLTLSTTCCFQNCGKGGFFTRLTICENCGKNFCGKHWRKLKDVRLLERCSQVATFNVCNTCETIMNLLETALAELEPKAMTAFSSSSGGAATAISSADSSQTALEPVADEADFQQKSKRNQQLNVFEQQRASGSVDAALFTSSSSSNNVKRNNKITASSTTQSAVPMLVVANSLKPTISMTVHDIFFDRQSPNWIPVAKYDDGIHPSKTKLHLDFVVPKFWNVDNNNDDAMMRMNLGLMIHTSIRMHVARVVAVSLVTKNTHNKNNVTNSALLGGEAVSERKLFLTSSSTLDWIGLSPARSFTTLSFGDVEENHQTAQARNMSSKTSSPTSIFQENQFTILRLELEVTDATLFRRYVNCIFIRQLGTSSSSSPTKKSTMLLQVSRPQKRKAIYSLFDDDTSSSSSSNSDNDNDDHDECTHRSSSSSPAMENNNDDNNDNTDSQATTSSSSNSAVSHHLSSILSSTSGGAAASCNIQYSSEVTADMSVRNMIMYPRGLKTQCRIWMRPPTAMPQPGQAVSSTHGVWGDAAGIMLRLSFGVSPTLYRNPALGSSAYYYLPQFPVSATSVHSFRTFVIERDISCRARHAATLAVPLVYLVSRSEMTQNSVEVFVPFGKSVKEDDAAGFVLDVETVEKMDPSTRSKNVGWEQDWSSLADSSSPFFVRDNKNLPSLVAATNNTNSNMMTAAAAMASNNQQQSTRTTLALPSSSGVSGSPTLSRMTLTTSSSLTTNFKGSPVATVNVSDLGKNAIF